MPKLTPPLTVALSLALTLIPALARAQVHWDASAQAGVTRRVLGDRPSGGGEAGFGPAAELTSHVALLPLVRLGAYFGYDLSPVSGQSSARDLTWGGARVKLMSPWPRGALRAWLFFGLGWTGVYARSTAGPRTYPGAAGAPSVQSEAVVHGAHGGFLEVPYGLGASYKLRKPWELCAELGMRSGFAHAGGAYTEPGPRVTSPGHDETNALPAGKDRFAIGLTLGVLVDL